MGRGRRHAGSWRIRVWGMARECPPYHAQVLPLQADDRACSQRHLHSAATQGYHCLYRETSASTIYKQMAQARVDAHQGIVAVATHARNSTTIQKLQPPACTDLRKVSLIILNFRWVPEQMLFHSFSMLALALV